MIATVAMTDCVICSGLAAGCARATDGTGPEGATALAVIFGLAALIIGSHL